MQAGINIMVKGPCHCPTFGRPNYPSLFSVSNTNLFTRTKAGIFEPSMSISCRKNLLIAGLESN